MRTSTLRLQAMLSDLLRRAREALNVSVTAGLSLMSGAVMAATPIASLDIQAYMGTWHQVAHYPNRFQRDCQPGTSTASYRWLADRGQVEVINRCATASGGEDVVNGVARPSRDARVEGGQLQPASLRVTFVPAVLRWLPPVWAPYDVVHLSADGKLAIVSEPSQDYLWVLSRTPGLDDAARAQVTELLRQRGFDLSRLRFE